MIANIYSLLFAIIHHKEGETYGIKWVKDYLLETIGIEKQGSRTIILMEESIEYILMGIAYQSGSLQILGKDQSSWLAISVHCMASRV